MRAVVQYIALHDSFQMLTCHTNGRILDEVTDRSWPDRAKSVRELLTTKPPFLTAATETFRVNLEGRRVAETNPRGSAPNPALAAWQGVGLKTQPHP